MADDPKMADDLKTLDDKALDQVTGAGKTLPKICEPAVKGKVIEK